MLTASFCGGKNYLSIEVGAAIDSVLLWDLWSQLTLEGRSAVFSPITQVSGICNNEEISQLQEAKMETEIIPWSGPCQQKEKGEEQDHILGHAVNDAIIW